MRNDSKVKLGNLYQAKIVWNIRVAKNISNALRRACFHKFYPCFALNLGTTPKHDLLSDETRPNVQTFAGVGDELPNKLHTDPLLLKSNWVNMYRIYPAESCTLPQSPPPSYRHHIIEVHIFLWIYFRKSRELGIESIPKTKSLAPF